MLDGPAEQGVLLLLKLLVPLLLVLVVGETLLAVVLVAAHRGFLVVAAVQRHPVVSAVLVRLRVQVLLLVVGVLGLLGVDGDVVQRHGLVHVRNRGIIHRRAKSCACGRSLFFRFRFFFKYFVYL